MPVLLNVTAAGVRALLQKELWRRVVLEDSNTSSFKNKKDEKLHHHHHHPTTTLNILQHKIKVTVAENTERAP